MGNILSWLESWYIENIDGDWEHNYGVKIDTIDNPGWSVLIDLNETKYQNYTLDKVEVENSSNDWYSYKVDSGKFIAFGSPNKLNFILETFKKLVHE